MAHLGDPINIGPFLHNGEWHEAQGLVRGPLKALGYRFESPDLVSRILGRTKTTIRA